MEVADVAAEMAATSLGKPEGRVLRRMTKIKQILEDDVEKWFMRRVLVGGWVKTGREQGKGSFAFLEVNDGSCLANLQVCLKHQSFVVNLTGPVELIC
jgi:asparaginyl-tRNA synthetase